MYLKHIWFPNTVRFRAASCGANGEKQVCNWFKLPVRGGTDGHSDIEHTALFAQDDRDSGAGILGIFWMPTAFRSESIIRVDWDVLITGVAFTGNITEHHLLLKLPLHTYIRHSSWKFKQFIRKKRYSGRVIEAIFLLWGRVRLNTLIVRLYSNCMLS